MLVKREASIIHPAGMSTDLVRWFVLLPVILVVFLVILGQSIYKLRGSEAYALGVQAAASHLNVRSDALRLAWWDNITFAEGPTHGGAEFRVCGSVGTCVKVTATKRAGTWSLAEVTKE